MGREAHYDTYKKWMGVRKGNGVWRWEGEGGKRRTSSRRGQKGFNLVRRKLVPIPEGDDDRRSLGGELLERRQGGVDDGDLTNTET